MLPPTFRPYTEEDLERYRLRARQQRRASLVGGHLMRRKGASLEFYEYAPYTLGDDVRHIDWRASARFGSDDDLLVRRFTAEEQLRILISIDARETMALPAHLPKRTVAVWLAEVLTWVALRSNDDVILHRLFGDSSPTFARLRGAGSVQGIRAAVASLAQPVAMAATANLEVLNPKLLPPAAVWVILTDCYFRAGSDANELRGSEAQRLADRMAEAQDGMRWVILVDLDSWGWEKSQLDADGAGYWLVEGPDVVDPRRLESAGETLAQVQARIEDYKHQFIAQGRRSGLDISHWQWPTPARSKMAESGARQFFWSAFEQDLNLQRLFMREQ